MFILEYSCSSSCILTESNIDTKANITFQWTISIAFEGWYNYAAQQIKCPQKEQRPIFTKEELSFSLVFARPTFGLQSNKGSKIKKRLKKVILLISAANASTKA